MTTKFKRTLSVIACIVLIAALALLTVGCSDKTNGENELPETNETVQITNSETDAQTPVTSTNDVTTVGQGQKQFSFSVFDLDGNETKFIVKTDADTVGKALIDAGLIEGEDGPYGLYVKKVNGIFADYDVDQTYWAFYVDGEYGMNGVDKTDIEDGKVYSFRVSK